MDKSERKNNVETMNGGDIINMQSDIFDNTNNMNIEKYKVMIKTFRNYVDFDKITDESIDRLLYEISNDSSIININMSEGINIYISLVEDKYILSDGEEYSQIEYIKNDVCEYKLYVEYNKNSNIIHSVHAIQRVEDNGGTRSTILNVSSGIISVMYSGVSGLNNDGIEDIAKLNYGYTITEI